MLILPSSQNMHAIYMEKSWKSSSSESLQNFGQSMFEADRWSSKPPKVLTVGLDDTSKTILYNFVKGEKDTVPLNVAAKFVINTNFHTNWLQHFQCQRTRYTRHFLCIAWTSVTPWKNTSASLENLLNILNILCWQTLLTIPSKTVWTTVWTTRSRAWFKGDYVILSDTLKPDVYSHIFCSVLQYRS